MDNDKSVNFCYTTLWRWDWDVIRCGIKCQAGKKVEKTDVLEFNDTGPLRAVPCHWLAFTASVIHKLFLWIRLIFLSEETERGSRDKFKVTKDPLAVREINVGMGLKASVSIWEKIYSHCNSR